MKHISLHVLYLPLFDILFSADKIHNSKVSELPYNLGLSLLVLIIEAILRSFKDTY